MKTSSNNSFSPCSDEDLMCFVQQGNIHALRILIHRYKTDITRFAYHYSGSYSTAIDTARDTFVSLFQTAAYYTTSNEFSSWVFSIALQLSLATDPCINLQEVGSTHSRQNAKAIERLLFPDIVLRDHLVGSHVQEVLCSVADVPRAVLIFRDIFLFPSIKIAAITDCDHKTVEVLCEQGRREFRSKLRQLHEKRCMPN